jgi:hypothetical protein
MTFVRVWVFEKKKIRSEDRRKERFGFPSMKKLSRVFEMDGLG